MYYSEELKEYKKAGFINTSIKKGKASKKEVFARFGKFMVEQPKPAPKFVIVNGVPYKRVNGKLVPLTKVES